MTKPILHKGDVVYYARIFPSLGMYDLDELKIRTVADNYFVGIEKYTKKAFLFSYNAIGKTVFIDRKDALKKVREAEKHRIQVSEETYYEEY